MFQQASGATSTAVVRGPWSVVRTRTMPLASRLSPLASHLSPLAPRLLPLAYLTALLSLKGLPGNIKATPFTLVPLHPHLCIQLTLSFVRTDTVNPQSPRLHTYAARTCPLSTSTLSPATDGSHWPSLSSQLLDGKM